jgi:hypothetical protein
MSPEMYTWLVHGEYRFHVEAFGSPARQSLQALFLEVMA